MKKNPAILIANAIIWGAVIVGVSLKLRGTDCYQEIQNLLAAGAGMSLFVVMGVFLPFKKDK